MERAWKIAFVLFELMKNLALLVQLCEVPTLLTGPKVARASSHPLSEIGEDSCPDLPHASYVNTPAT